MTGASFRLLLILLEQTPHFQISRSDIVISKYAQSMSLFSAFRLSINLRSEKLQNKVSPNFSNVHPDFCTEFLSDFHPFSFLRSFRALSDPNRSDFEIANR